MSQIFSSYTQNNLLPERSSSRIIGQTGEELAAQFLTEKGCRLVAANFKVPIGRNRSGAQVTGEIDIIAYENDVLCFVEVKTRSSDRFASPLAAIDARKQRQIIRAARMYRKIFRLFDTKFRYDAVSIIIQTDERPKIEFFKSFWTETKFAKKFWSDDFFVS